MGSNRFNGSQEMVSDLIDKSNVFTKAARKVSRDNFITHS